MPRVTQKGQVTIPRQIIAMLSITTGDEVVFDKELTLRLKLKG